METEISETPVGNDEGENSGGSKGSVGLARVISVILNPLLLPTWGALLLLYGPTYLSILPHSLKMYIAGTFLLTTFFFPLFAIGVMRSLKLVSDYELSRQRERILPLLVVAAGYASCFYLIFNRVNVGVFPQMLIGALAIVAFCFIVNFGWKISLHMAAIGGILAILLDVTLKGYGQMAIPLAAFIVLAGALGSARLYLGAHNVWQVLAGTLAGFSVMLLALNLF